MGQQTLEPMMEAIRAVVDRQADEEFLEKGVWTIGELIIKMENLKPTQKVRFEDGTYPGHLDSYRGFYRYLAVRRTDKPCTVKKFLELLQEAVGGIFIGYKGGEFKMTRHTFVWVSEYGCVSGEAIVGVETEGKDVVLKVREVSSM